VDEMGTPREAKDFRSGRSWERKGKENTYGKT
jgi:hypothetical protein